MPRLIDGETRTDLVAGAVNHLMAIDGAAGLTLRRIAEVARLSPASLSSHYGSREHMLRVVAHRTGRARLRIIRRRSHAEGPAAFVPEDDDDLVTARVWLGWCELARGQEWLEQTVDELRDDELDLLASCVHHRLDRRELLTLRALLDGLQVAVCSPVRPLGMTEARGLVAGYLACLGTAA